MSFDHLGLDVSLVRAVRRLGFTAATPIQAEAIPLALQGRDVLASAVTGSGKTAAFLLPLLQRLLGVRRGTTRALVLTPTRELAAQVEAQLQALAAHTGITGAAVYGGVGMAPQERAFREGVDVVVATPGRLLDHFQHPYARCRDVEMLVLDEADRMLDMGFLPAIRRVLQHLTARRQTLFFSATMPPDIVALAGQILRDPATVRLAPRTAPAAGVVQAVYPVPQERKAALLAALLRDGTVQEALVFTRTKHRANRLAESLARQGVVAARIHGNRSQAQRTAALDGFKAGRIRVLVATDVAARGIDVSALGHVVNFDVPGTPADYVHRVGRTARAGASGHALTFVAPDEDADLRAIERTIATRIARRTLPGFDYACAGGEPLEIPLRERLQRMRARASGPRGGTAMPRRGAAAAAAAGVVAAPAPAVGHRHVRQTRRAARSAPR